MEALINAGGKGTRMGVTGIEKPMQVIGGKHVVERVVRAMQYADRIGRVLVSVSPNTPNTEAFLKDIGVETIRTSGEDFMGDLHQSFEVLTGKYVVTCPSDIPLLNADIVDRAVGRFDPSMQSMIVMVDADVVRGMGIRPSYTRVIDEKEWVLSGLSIMDREATLRGEFLNEECLFTNWHELAVNVNTQDELSVARRLFGRSFLFFRIRGFLGGPLGGRLLLPVGDHDGEHLAHAVV